MRLVSICALVLASSSACGGNTENATPGDVPANDCAAAADISDEIGNGPLDALFAATRACDDTAASVRAGLDQEVEGLASAFQVDPARAGDKVTMSELVSAIETYFGHLTDGGLTLTVSALSCAPNDLASASAEQRCLAEAGCDTAGGRCPAREACTEMARLNGLASLTCVGPFVDATYVLSSSAPPVSDAEFSGRLNELKFRGADILGTYARISALVTGKVNGEVAFAPAPLVQISDELQRVASGDRVTELNLSPGCVQYVVPRFIEGLATMNGLATGSADLLADGERFAALF